MIRTSVLILTLAAMSPAIGTAQSGVELAAETALRGNARDALHLLARLSPDKLQIEDRSFRQCMVSRFGSRKPGPPSSLPADPFAAAVLAAYRAYWHSALRNPQRERAARKRLGARLQRLASIDPSNPARPALRNLSDGEYQTLRTLALAGGGPGDPRMDPPSYPDLAKRSPAPEEQANAHGRTALETLGPAIRQKLSDLGYFSIEREAGSLRDLVLWRKQTTRSQQTQLADDPREVTVVDPEDVHSLGWKDYATCGRNAPGRWAATDALYGAARPGPPGSEKTR